MLRCSYNPFFLYPNAHVPCKYSSEKGIFSKRFVTAPSDGGSGNVYAGRQKYVRAFRNAFIC